MPGRLDAAQIEDQLFRPGPRYLLGLFCQPEVERKQGLADAAEWFGLDGALARADDTADLRTELEKRWVGLLATCEHWLDKPSQKHELRALLRALETLSRMADANPKSAKLDQLWKEMSKELVEQPGRSATKEQTGTGSATLRGRKWGALRPALAHALVSLTQPQSFYAREPRDPPLFDKEDLKTVGDALADPGNRGMAVIVAPPGSGRTELAMAFAHARMRDNTYERVFVLRATDPLRLEQDFLGMGKRLTGRTGDRARVRRGVFEALENSGRWLIVFASVQDPAALLALLPWNPDGHVICTTWPDPVEEGDPDPWMTHLNLVADRNSAISKLAQRGLEPDEIRSIVREFLPRALHDDDPALAALKDMVGASRHAAALARAWFELTAPTPPDGPDPVEHGRAQLTEYPLRWARAADQFDAEAREKKNIRSRGEGYRAAVLAARVLLEELHVGTEVEQDALALLFRLEPFADESLTSSTFPVSLLDDTKYGEVADRIDDRRLVRLDQLALADRATGLHEHKYFDINAGVLHAVRHLMDTVNPAPNPVAVASQTMLRLLGGRPEEGRPPEESFELLPHAQALADREETEGERPLVAAELHMRAALIHLLRGRPRIAHQQVAAARNVIAELAGPIDALDAWPDELDPAPEPSTKRMGKLVRAVRTAGQARIAADLFDDLIEIVEEDTPFADPGKTPNYVARLYFEGAMANLDLDDLQKAGGFAEEARKRWSALGKEREREAAMAENFQAELAFVQGEFAKAHDDAIRVKATRERLLNENTDPSFEARLISEVARSDFLLGRIAYVQGRLMDAERLLGASVTHWEAARDKADEDGPRFSTLNLLMARSFQALMTAHRGNLDEARRLADDTGDDLDALHPEDHYSDVTIRSNVAQVLRMSGRVRQAAAEHERAVRIADRMWSRRPKSLHVLRRKCAETFLEAGRPADALRQLMVLLEPLPADAPVGEQLMAARTWSVLARLLTENSLAAFPLLERRDADLLSLARELLEKAERLYEGADPPNPGVIGCLLGLSEIAIRGRAPDALAERHAARALGLAVTFFPERSAPLAPVEAKLIRARIVSAGDDPAELERFRDEVGELVDWTGGIVRTSGDRFEIALARAELAMLEWRVGEMPGDKALKASRDAFVEALAPLYDAIGSQPHQLPARMYAEMAAQARRVGAPDNRRARSMREVERLRPPVEIPLVQLSITAAGLLGN